MELYARVRRAVQVEELSERGAAREFGISRETVLLNIHTEPGYERIIRALGTRVYEAQMTHAGWEQRVEVAEKLAELYADIGLRPVVLPTGP